MTELRGRHSKYELSKTFADMCADFCLLFNFSSGLEAIDYIDLALSQVKTSVL